MRMMEVHVLMIRFVASSVSQFLNEQRNSVTLVDHLVYDRVRDGSFGKDAVGHFHRFATTEARHRYFVYVAVKP